MFNNNNNNNFLYLTTLFREMLDFTLSKFYTRITLVQIWATLAKFTGNIAMMRKVSNETLTKCFTIAGTRKFVQHGFRRMSAKVGGWNFPLKEILDGFLRMNWFVDLILRVKEQNIISEIIAKHRFCYCSES